MNTDDEAKRWFQELPDAKKKRLHAMMTELFPKLEAEWRVNPDNKGKSFSYSQMWEDFVSRQKDQNKKQ